MAVIKNRNVPGGNEFWDHVENVAKNIQPPAAAPAPQAEGLRCPTCHSTSQNIINRVAYNVNRPYHGEWCKDSWHMGAAPAETAGPKEKEMDAVTYGTCAAEAHRIEGKPFLHTYMDTCQNWEARETAGEMTAETAANNLLRRLSREIFEDGIDIEKLPEAVGIVEDAFKQRVEQVERERDRLNGFILGMSKRIETDKAKVADLERERDDLKESLRIARQAVLGILPRAEAAESELREMREALEDFVQQLKRALQQNKEAELVELIANGNRLLARKAGS